MPVNRQLRSLAAVLAGVGVLTAAGPIPPAARAQQQPQCLPPGSPSSPVPWQQQMLAPERAWPMSSGGGQRVAVIGTGIADTNPQLAGRVVGSTDLSPPDQRASGKPDCIGSGTGVAGTIGARRAANIGFHGVAPDAQLLSAKVIGDQAPSSSSSGLVVPPDVLAEAISWAVDQQATVITVTAPAYQDTIGMRAAITKANQANVLVVAATGEVSQDTPPEMRAYPAAYGGVLGVSGVGQDGQVNQASRPGDVDLVAPGYDVQTTYPDGGVGIGPGAGSAYAAGYVAGAAALARASTPNLSSADTRKKLVASAAAAPEATGSPNYGYGMVNPYQSVVENVVSGSPAPLPPMETRVATEAEKAREAEQDSSDRLATVLAASGAALVVVVATVIAFGARGRRRRWRSGLAEVPVDRPEDDLPEAPVELFADRQQQDG